MYILFFDKGNYYYYYFGFCVDIFDFDFCEIIFIIRLITINLTFIVISIVYTNDYKNESFIK